MTMNAKAKAGNSDKWGLGLLVLFLDDDKSLNSSSKKKKSPSLITRAQSTISICALIIVFTILLFSLSTSEPTSLSPTPFEISFPKRWLAQTPQSHFTGGSSSSSISRNSNTRLSSSGVLKKKKKKSKWKIIVHNAHRDNRDTPFALQGMGTLFRRGNRAMAELLVAHLTENTTEDDLRWFLRTLHRSGLMARADVVFIFPSSSSSHLFSSVIQQENDSFTKLLLHHIKNKTSATLLPSVTHFNLTLFKNNRTGEPLWGYRNHTNSSNGEEDDLGGLSWGSVVGFEAAELDPEDSLAGFFDRVPMQLRRWACYQMLLGRIRRNFKQILLVDVNDIWILGDVFSRVRTRSSEAMHMWTSSNSSCNDAVAATATALRSNSNKDRGSVDPKLSAIASIVMGGIRSVRRLSNAVLMETVRVATQRKTKTRISDSAILTRLLWNTSLPKKIKISFHSLPNSNAILSGGDSNGYVSELEFIARGDCGENLRKLVVTEICSSSSSYLNSFVYTDC